MEHRLEARVGCQHPGHLVQRQFMEPDAIGDVDREPCRQVVEHHDIVARLDQGMGHYAPDVACTTGY
jgi:hypothetical protein